MRAPALALAALIVASLFIPSTSAEDFGAVGKVNKLIDIQQTPELAPGESGRFVFDVNSTFSEPIFDVRLNVSIYRYATIDESIPVDDAWAYAYPRIANSSPSSPREWAWTRGRVDPNLGSIPLEFMVLTAADSDDMPHGTIFSQSSYFVRFWLEFNTTGNLTRYRMASPGYFSAALWDLAQNETYTNPCTPPWCRGNVNLTVLGVDGILPDSAFGVKEPIPRWPFYLLIVLAAFFLVLAFLFWVEENPGAYPRVEAWWARTRGRLARTIPRVRRRRPPNG
ncbi:MAG TPA: hypothetical protein VF992_08405 [Thermoplasmata archaeon]